MNEVDKFFNELPSEDKKEADIFSDKKPEVKAPENGETSKGDESDEGEVRKNRRHRRLEEQLERERKMNIALNERLIQALGAKEAPAADTGDVPAEWIALYGDSPESQKAWKMQERVLESYGQRVKEETLREIESRQEREIEEERTYEEFIDANFEALEDKYNVDLTSDAPVARKARREFLELVEKLSPKDEDGQITGYADFDSTFEIYKNSLKNDAAASETASRAKEIAARSMQQSGQGAAAMTKAPTPGFRGWMKDFNIG